MLYEKVKDILIISTILIILCYVWLSQFSIMAKAPVVDYSNQLESLSNSLQSLIDSQYSEPISIEIKSIKLNVSITPVGIEKDGSMEVPKDFYKVGWLKTSSKLGQKGNLVLSGHYDTPTGTPAVFDYLQNIKQGDIVKITTQLQSGLIDFREYRVTEIYLADPNNNDHVKEVYKNTEHPTITIITCNGIWNPVKHEYSHRVVVKGELVD